MESLKYVMTATSTPFASVTKGAIRVLSNSQTFTNFIYFVKNKLNDGTFGWSLEFNIPLDFAKHGSRTTNVPNWRTKIWILNCNGEKFKIENTCLLKYYSGDQYQRPHQEVSHRDVFLSCSACKKVRRFELRSRDACRFYHDAELNENRSCSDMIPGR